MEKNVPEAMIKAGLSEEQAKFAYSTLMHGSFQIASHGSVPLQAMILKKGAESERDAMMMLACPEVGDDTTKDMFMETVRFMAHQENASSVALLMEAWTMPANKTQEEINELITKYGSISAMPDKREAICVMGNTEEGKFQIEAPIERDSDGNLTELAKLKIHTEKDGEMSGRMIYTRYTDEDIADPKFSERLDYMSAYLDGRLATINPEETSDDNASTSVH